MKSYKIDHEVKKIIRPTVLSTDLLKIYRQKQVIILTSFSPNAIICIHIMKVSESICK